MQKIKRVSKTTAVIIFIVSFYSLAMSLGSQDEENIRKIWDSAFLKKRPESTKPNKPNPTNVARKNPTYRRVPTKKITTEENKVATLNLENSTLIGVTLWRLRPVQPNDELTTRILVQEEMSGGIEFIPERVEIGELLSEGQRVRLSIEVPREGYLYVIDREKYIDGLYSEPYLIFPTTRTRNGNNQVTAGVVIEVPALDDKPPYFRLRSLGKPKYSGEELSILVSSNPIASLKLTGQSQKLSKAQFDELERKWGANAEILTLEDSAGKTYTPIEKNAANGKEKALTQTDPLPQTLYQVASKVGEPLLIKIPLEIKR